MSENQYLEIIENKLDAVSEMVAQQSKSGVFFDGFTKEVLEKIHDKLDYISNFETQELVSYLTNELKKNFEDRNNIVQNRLDVVQNQLNIVQANLSESLKSPEITEIFTKLSDNILNFSRDLNAQTRYYNSTIENINSEIGKINVEEKLQEQTARIKEEIANYENNLQNLSENISSSFRSVKTLIENNAPSEAIVALSGDISVIQKGLNDVISSVVMMNNKHNELVQSVAGIVSNMDMQDVRQEVSALVADIQVLKESIRALVNKSDIDTLNQKLSLAISSVSELKDYATQQGNDNKNILKSYFDDLNNIISNLVSKSENEVIQDKIESIKNDIESGQNSIQSIISQGNNDIKNIIPVISSLSTKENMEELVQSFAKDIDAFTVKWTESLAQNTHKVDVRLDDFSTILQNISSIVNSISPIIQEQSTQSELRLKEEFTSLSEYVSKVFETISSTSGSSISDLSEKMNEASLNIEEKVKKFEELLNSSQESLRESLREGLSEKIDQLREFSQKLIDSISTVENKIGLQTDSIKQIVKENCELLDVQIKDIKELYAKSNVENKTEILNSINALSTNVEEIKSLVANNGSYEAIIQKISEVEGLFANSKSEMLSSGLQVAGAISNQADMLDAINNSIKDLYINIADTKAASLSNKEAIIQEFSKIHLVAENAKTDIENRLVENFENVNKKIDNLSTNFETERTSSAEILQEINTFAGLAENLNSQLKEALEKSSLSNKQEILENIDNNSQVFKTQIEKIESTLAATTQILQSDLTITKGELSENFVKNIDTVVQKLDFISSNFEAGSNNNREQILEGLKNLQTITDDFKNNFNNIAETLPKESFIVEQTERVVGLIVDFSHHIQSKLLELGNADKDYIYQAVQEAFVSFAQQISDSLNYIKGVSLSLDRNFTVTRTELLDGLSELKESFNKFRGDFDESFTSQKNFLQEEVSSNFDSVISSNRADLGTAVESINKQLQNTKDELTNTIKTDAQNLVEQIDNLSEKLQTNSADNKEQILNTINELQNLSAGMEELLKNNKDDLLSSNRTDLAAAIELLNTNLKDSKEGILDELKGLLTDNNNANSEKSQLELNTLTEKINQQLHLTKEEIINNLQTDAQNYANQMDSFSEKLKTNSADNKEQILNAINELKNLSVSLEDLIKINTDAVIANNNKELTSVVEDLNSRLQSAKEEITNTLQNGSQNIVGQIETLSDNLKSSYFTDLKDLAKENSLDAIKAIEDNAKNLENKITQIITLIEETDLGEISVKDLLEQLEVFKSSSNELKEDIKNVNNKLLKREDISSEVDRIEQSLNTLSSNLLNRFNEMGAKDVDAELGELQAYISSLKTDLVSISATLNQAKVEIIDALEGLKVSDNTNESDNEAKINAFVNEVRTLLDTSFNNLSNVLTKEKIENGEFKESLSIELKNAINEISEKLFKAEENNSSLRSELLYELQKSYNILNEKVDNQSDKTNELKTLIDESLKTSFNDIEEMIERKYTKIQSNVIKDVAEINLEEIKEEICQDVADSAIVVKEKLEELINNISQNKELYEQLAKNNCNDILSQLYTIKEEISVIKTEDTTSKLIIEIQKIAQQTEEISNRLLDELTDDLDESFAKNIRIITEAVEDKISFIKDDIQEVLYKLSQVDAIVDKVKEIVTMQFDDFLDTFNLKMTMFGNDVKNLVDTKTDKLTALIEEYQKELKGLSDIDLREYSEDTKRFVEEQIQSLKDKIDELKLQNEAGLISNDVKETITSSANNINKRLELLRDMILAEMPNSDEISESFDEIKSALSSVSIKTEGFAEIVRNENASLRDIIKSYQAQINALSNIEVNNSADDNTRGFIREELKQLKEQFVRSLTGVFENISFIEESEEIQNVIFDNVSEIKDEIEKLKRDLIANSNSNSDIDEKFANLKNILESITTGASSGDSGKYIYTLPDVETDIAKMRMAINDVTEMIKKNREDGYDVVERLDSIDDIREDISSISKRTNKLILTSDDVNKHLRENIAEFKKIIDEVSDKCNKIDSTQLNRNIIDVKALVMSGLKSDQILNEAFMHLAQWIDDSARTMNSIDSQIQDNAKNIDELKSKIDTTKEKADEIADLKNALNELFVKLDKKSDVDYSKSLYEIEYGLDKLSDKLDVQELKIKSLEKKIESLSSSQNGNEEITSLLEFIASQVSAANENSRGNKLLLQKIEMMEKQMNQFENSISKITAFVDGAN